MKTLYEFTLTQKIKKEVTKDTPDGKLTTIEEVDNPILIKIKSPSRAELEDGKCEYQKYW